MSIAIYALLFLAVFHFVYESIIAPSLRLGLRFELFEIRDEARTLKIECENALDDRHFEYLQDFVNNLISVLYRFDVATLVTAENRARHDPEFKKRAEERAQILDDCNIPHARTVRWKTLRVAAKALAVNSGACALYLVPVAFCIALHSMIKARIKLFASLSGQDFKKVAPADSITVSPS